MQNKSSLFHYGFFVVAMTTALLTGCGGSSDGGTSSTSSSSSSPAPTPAPGQAPSAPTGLSVTAGDTQITLAWSVVSGASSYNVKRANVSGGPYTAIRTGLTTNSFLNTGLANGTTYYYVVSAVNNVGESAASAQASAIPRATVGAPFTPTGFNAVAGDTRVTLTWDTVTGATGYKLYRDNVVIASPTTVNYTDVAVSNGRMYAYTLSATNSAGESARSSTVNAAPAKGLPTVGAWLGATPGEITLAQFETLTQRKLDIYHTYKGIGSAPFPSASDIAIANGGRLLLINWKPEQDNVTKTIYTWPQIAAGMHDAYIDRVAAQIVAQGVRFFIVFHHEPEDEITGANTVQAYVDMQRHIHDRLIAQGAGPYLIFVWNMMGYSGHQSLYEDAVNLYPGDDYVDWIAWDPYSHDSGWPSFEQFSSYFYDWAQTNHPSKPLMLAEFGVTEKTTDANFKANWYAQIVNALKTTRPALRALVYFHHNSDFGNVWVDSSPQALQSYIDTGHDPYLSVH